MIVEKKIIINRLLTYFNFISLLTPYLFTFLRIGPFRFQAGGRKRARPVFGVYFVLCMFAFVELDLVFQYQAKRLSGKNYSK